MVKKPVFVFVLLLSFALVFTACGKNDTRIRIGYSDGFLSAALFTAQEEFSRSPLRLNIQQFRSSSDIAYALLAGVLDTGFVEAEKLAAFAALDGFDRLAVVGKVTYPYGATMVLRKGLNVRLHELGGLSIAASAPDCVLFEEFAEDAGRLGADIDGINIVYMAFDAMIPALEAGVIDAAIIRGSFTVIALHAGHSVLYQNWEVEPGDECCPAIVDQSVLVQLARRNRLELIQPLINAMVSAQQLSPDELRRAVANNTVIPFEILQGQPVPEFSLADEELTAIFIEAAEHHEDGHEDDHDE